MKDKELLYRVKTNDKKAFDKLFLFYYKDLCRFALTFVKSADDSEDVVQRLFVSLWENRKKLEIPENVKAYLFKSVYFESMKFLRHKKTSEKYLSNYLTYFSPVDDNDTDFSVFLPYLHKAIEKLPEKCRQIFILNKMEGLTQKEIAEYLEISAKTVENQVGNAISKLRKELKPYLHLLPASLFFIIFH